MAVRTRLGAPNRRPVALAVTTDGRDHLLHEAIRSAEENLHGQRLRIAYRVMHDDTGDPDHREDLKRRYGPDGWEVIGRRRRVGYADAVRNLWMNVAARPVEFVFHLEDDFTFNGPVDLDELADLLDHYPYLSQVALLRQPWFPREKRAGGIYEVFPGEFVERHDPDLGLTWVEHRTYYTANPHLTRRTLVGRGWPRGARSERKMTQLLNRDPANRFAYLGGLHDPPRVTHHGDVRMGTNY